MRAFDLTPLLRSSVGFDRFNRAFEVANRVDDAQLSYPPYNIEKLGDDGYHITMAVAGFTESDIDITITEETLVIAGKQEAEEDDVTFLHRGIARRSFERRFQLADSIKVTGARLENGLLHVDLVREVPEHKKPRQIPISTVTVDAQAA